MIQKEEELKVLRELDDLITNWPAVQKRRLLRGNMILIASWAASVFAFSLVNYEEIKQVVAVALAIFSGIFAGRILLGSGAGKAIPIIRAHINRDSIAARIKELET